MISYSYLAGFIDGEGCIGFTQCRGNLVPRLVITNTNLDIIEALKEQFGGYITIPKKYNSSWKQGYHWTLTGNKAVDLLDKCIKHLKIKTSQAEALFAFSATQPGSGRSWTQEGKEACEWLKEYVHELNQKGDNYEESRKV